MITVADKMENLAEAIADGLDDIKVPRYEVYADMDQYRVVVRIPSKYRLLTINIIRELPTYRFNISIVDLKWYQARLFKRLVYGD